jgi:hypothetical protein
VVLESAVHDVRHRLEAPVWMPWRTLRFARRILNRAQVVEQQEWVRVLKIGVWEGAPHLEAFALEAEAGAVTTFVTGRNLARAASGRGRRGSTRMFSAVTAGISDL